MEIDCWYPQDAKRQRAHELLEAETIKASVLRHRLAVFPHKLRAELSGKLYVDTSFLVYLIFHTLSLISSSDDVNP